MIYPIQKNNLRWRSDYILLLRGSNYTSVILTNRSKQYYLWWRNDYTYTYCSTLLQFLLPSINNRLVMRSKSLWYALNASQHRLTKHKFSTKQNFDEYQIRERKIFSVNFGRTEKYKKNAITYLQNKLNVYYKETTCQVLLWPRNHDMLDPVIQ